MVDWALSLIPSSVRKITTKNDLDKLLTGRGSAPTIMLQGLCFVAHAKSGVLNLGSACEPGLWSGSHTLFLRNVPFSPIPALSFTLCFQQA